MRHEDPFFTKTPQWEAARSVGATCVEGKVVRVRGLIVAGLGGSIFYNGGENQYTDLSMFLAMLRLLPGLLWHRVFHGRFLDVLLTHSPPYGINDLPDPCHTGFRFFLWFMRTFKPRYLVHGHVHLYDRNAAREARYGSTTIINAYDHVVIELETGTMSNERVYSSMARSDFSRLRTRATFMRILSLLKPQNDEMLSLGDVRALLRPSSETYRGMKTIPIAKIVGSEGRYKDFNRAFLPRHDTMAKRWISVDVAHYRNVELPAINVFELGGVYFVRDGNHRVSVAKSRGAAFIDAEVISLSSEITLSPSMGMDELKSAVIDFEKKRFFATTHLDALRPACDIAFSDVGRYDELLSHIREHKWYINLKKTEEIPFEQAAVSWFDNVYEPIARIIREGNLLARFPGATEGDLYVYVGRHWSELVKRYGPLFTLEEAAEDFSFQATLSFARRAALRVQGWFRALVSRPRR